MACPVCFGGDDSMMRESLNAGIGVLLGVTGIVLGLFARFFVQLARRSREAAHLVGVGFDTPSRPEDTYLRVTPDGKVAGRPHGGPHEAQ